MKTPYSILTLVLLAGSAAVLPAQIAETKPVSLERGLHHQVLQNVIAKTNETTGEVSIRTNRYTQIAPGLQYRAADGTLQETKELIQPVPGGAVAHEGPHTVAFALNANLRGAIRYVSARNELLESHVLCLMMGDAGGKWVTLGVIKDAPGQITAPNVVTYADAFAGIKADLRYTYRRDSFEQDIVLREQVDPAAHGLDPKTTFIQVITEWVDYPGRLILDERDNPFLQVEPLDERQMKLGQIRFGPGRAFAEPQPLAVAGMPAKRVPIQKRFARLNGRDCLIEQANFSDLQPLMARLPKAQAAAPKAGAARWVDSLAAALPPAPARLNPASAKRSMEIAQISKQTPNGVVLDYVLITSDLNNYTFTNGTYLISDTIYLTGTNTFQPGAILKFDEYGSLYSSGTLIWPDQPQNPVIFTSQYDNEVGDYVATGDPTNSYSYALVNDATNFNVSNARFRFAQVPIENFDNTAPLTGSNLVIDNGAIGIIGDYTGGRLFNVLFYNLTYAVAFSGTSSGEQITAHLVDQFDMMGNLSLTNSLMVEVNTLGVAATNYVAVLADDTGVFESGPLGSHYLASGQTGLIDQGNATASAVGLYHYTTATNQTREANSTVNLGFHYLALDSYGNAFDADLDGLPDYAEDTNGNGQYDAGETDLNDYYNGTLPQLSVSSGDAQSGCPSNWLAQPLVALVRDGSSQPLVNAPITFVITSGGGGLATATNGTPTNALTVITDASGLATAWMQLPSGYDATNTVIAAALSGTSSNTVTFTEYNFLQAEMPVISPDGGRFSLVPTVTVSCPTTNALIYYTVDGSEPTEDSILLETNSFTLQSSVTLKFKAFREDRAPSATKTTTFTIAGTLGAGMYHSLASDVSGVAWGWGLGSSGQLGLGTNVTIVSTPMAAVGISNITKICGGSGNSTLALKSDGTIWAWGYNANGTLGDGTTTNRISPVQTLNLTNVTELAAGTYHGLAVTATGTVYAWGQNTYGKLGDGTTTNRYSPVQVSGLTNATQLAGGGNHSLALIADGTVLAWGQNSYGQLGDTTTTNHYTPVLTSSLTNATSVSAGNTHSLALKSDGTVWAWGQNNSGQLGDGTTSNRYAPVLVTNLTDVVSISAGYAHNLALKTDGTVWAWGFNNSGQIGDNSTTNRVAPVQVSGLSNIVAVVGGYRHSLALENTGTIWAWGYGLFGQLGTGTNSSSSVPVPVANLKLMNPDDLDGDGISDGEESLLGTSPIRISTLSTTNEFNLRVFTPLQ